MAPDLCIFEFDEERIFNGAVIDNRGEYWQFRMQPSKVS